MRKRVEFPGALSSRVAAAGLAFLVAASAFPFGMADPTPALAPGVGTESIGGLTWTTDIRVTESSADDTEPQAYIDSNNLVHFLWRRAVGASASYYLASFDAAGERTQGETYITNGTVPSWGALYPLGPSIAMDSSNDVHVVYEKDFNNIAYQKFSADGSVLVPETLVGPRDSYSSTTPALSIAADDTVHIAHEDYRFQCEDIMYDKLANNGSVIWNSRVVTSDVASHAEFGLVKAGLSTGNVLFSLGSSTGTWLARFDKFGIKDMASVRIRAAADLKLTDVAETPDGNMHLAWVDGGILRYSRVNASGFKVVDNASMTSSATAQGFPHLEALSDNSVIIVWEDDRFGATQVMYAILRPGEDPASIGQVQLTHTSNGVYNPWVTVDPFDGLVVAWADGRNGNAEIYYKRVISCRAELSANPLDLGSMYFIHPGEARTLDLHLKNHGKLGVDFEAVLHVAGEAFDAGWFVGLNRTTISASEALEGVDIGLSIRAPANAQDGASITFEVTAAAGDGTACSDSMDFVQFVRVTRHLNLGAHARYRFADNGETVAFQLVAENRGDVLEPVVEINPGGTPVPDGWVVATDKDSLALEPGAWENFTVFVTVPIETWLAPGSMVARLAVTIRSAADAFASDAVEIAVQVGMRLVLNVSAESPERSAAAGTSVAFDLKVSNAGNLLGNAEIYLESSAAPQGWRALLDRQTVWLAGGQNTTFRLMVAVPSNALGGFTLALTVHAFAIKYGVDATTTVWATVANGCGLSLDAWDGTPAADGSFRTILVNAINTGNTAAHITLSATDLPDAWSVSYFLDGGATSRITIDAFAGSIVAAHISMPTRTPAGSYPIRLLFSVEGCGVYEAPRVLDIPIRRGVEWEASPLETSVALGGTAVFEVRAANLGNAPDAISLQAVALPPGFTARIVRLLPGDAGELSGDVTDPVSIEAWSPLGFRLYLSVPTETNVHSFSFDLEMGSAGNQSNTIELKVTVLWPDPSLAKVEFAPADPRVGFASAAKVTVANLGDYESLGGVVRFFVDGTEVGSQEVGLISPGSKVSVNFRWTPPAGVHELRFVFEPRSTVNEVNLDNNEIVMQGDFGQVLTTATSIDASDGLALLAVVGAAALFLALTVRRRRRDPRFAESPK